MQTRSQVKSQRASEPDYGKSITSNDMHRIANQVWDTIVCADLNNARNEAFTKFVDEHQGQLVFAAMLADRETGHISLNTMLWFTDPVQAHAYGQMLSKLPDDVQADIGHIKYDAELDRYFLYEPNDDGELGYFRKSVSKEAYASLAFKGFEAFPHYIKQAVRDRVIFEHYEDEFEGQGYIKYAIMHENGQQEVVDSAVVEKYVTEYA